MIKSKLKNKIEVKHYIFELRPFILGAPVISIKTNASYKTITPTSDYLEEIKLFVVIVERNWLVLVLIFLHWYTSASSQAAAMVNEWTPQPSPLL